jgi:heptosyltransferase-3
VQRILLIKPKRIGDLLLLTPTIAALKSVAPATRVEVLAYDRSSAILSYFPTIDRVWTLTGDGAAQRLADNSRELLETKFDAVIELSGQAKAAEILRDCTSIQRFRAELYGTYAHNALVAQGCSSIASKPEWLNEHAIRRDWLVVGHALDVSNLPAPVLRFPIMAENFPLPVEVGERFAVFQPFSRDLDRTWSVERWRQLAMEVLNQRVFTGIVIPFGSDDERQKAQWIAAGIVGCCIPDSRIDLAAHAALVGRAKACISCNTGVMHLAAAVQTPIVAVWGATPIKVWHPFSDRFAVVCQNEIISASAARAGTSIQDGAVDANAVQTVFEAVVRLLG